MYLHIDDRELFRDVVVTISEMTGLEESIVEKDYYVTMVLRLLADLNPSIVFKGGTSLSKAYHIIDRFSEDIDITFEEHIGEARRKKIKYLLIKKVSERLEMPIENWGTIESDKDYNHYDLVYSCINEMPMNLLRPYVKLETALMSYAYPTEECKITSIIYEQLKDTDFEILEKYGLLPFEMKVQSIERTFIDKLFAVCDYYMQDKPTRNSRHLYDIYKLGAYVQMDDKFNILLVEVRKHRSSMDVKLTPSARETVDLLQLVEEIVKSEFYYNDYQGSTMKLISEPLGYQEVIAYYQEVMLKLFDK